MLKKASSASFCAFSEEDDGGTYETLGDNEVLKEGGDWGLALAFEFADFLIGEAGGESL